MTQLETLVVRDHCQSCRFFKRVRIYLDVVGFGLMSQSAFDTLGISLCDKRLVAGSIWLCDDCFNARIKAEIKAEMSVHEIQT